MQPNTGIPVDEKSVLNKQYVAFAIGMLVFVPMSLISYYGFHTPKYGMLFPVAAMIYIGTSSIRNRVSVLRIRGKREPSRGKQAMIFGIVLIGIAMYAVIALFVPSLSKTLYPF